MRDLNNITAGWAVALATAAPTLLAFNLAPSPTLLNQCVAIGLWGGAVAAFGLTSVTVTAGTGRADTRWLQAALAATLLLVLLEAARKLPFGIACGAAATLWTTIVVVEAGAESARSGQLRLIEALAMALLLAGVLSAIVGCVQVFAPDWPDGEVIARSGMPGRAVGNLRQPNHLSSLLLWAVIALVALFELRRVAGVATWALGSLLLFALVLTGSRTGMLGMVVLAAWGSLDRQLSRRARLALIVSPVVYAAIWLGVSAFGHATGHIIGGEGRLSLGGDGDISSSRFAIWSNTLTMIAREPLAGVGFGEFNLAWTLSEFPHRPTAFFDHAHNLPLHLWVELGVPMGSLVFVLLLASLFQAWRRAWHCEGAQGVAKRAAFMLVLMIGLHSLLEYPLWYAYFLLPAAFAWGFALAVPGGALGEGAAAAPTNASGAPRSNRTLALAGIAMTVGAAAAVLDYWRVVVIYDPPERAAPLEERIERGQRSPLFGHHADYAAATAFGEPKAPLSPSQVLAFKRAPHQLLDVRLMIAWSQALAAQGEMDKARWLAARIREFRNPGADEYFAPCQLPEQAAQAFQCQPPQRVVGWREFTQQP
ncbi:MAG: Wzy polymerase domain-containing protein [Burkholderiales bacterium]